MFVLHSPESMNTHHLGRPNTKPALKVPRPACEDVRLPRTRCRQHLPRSGRDDLVHVFDPQHLHPGQPVPGVMVKDLLELETTNELGELVIGVFV